MYIYDTVENIVHDSNSLKIECGISQASKSYCVLINTLKQVDEQGLFTRFEKPKRCPHCMKHVD